MTQRTTQQNRSLHRWFRLVAEQLADQDYDFREVRVEIRPSEHLVKEYMFRPVAKALYGKESTADLSTGEVAEVYEHLNRLLADRFGIHVPFPSEDELSEAQRDPSR